MVRETYQQEYLDIFEASLQSFQASLVALVINDGSR